MVGTPFGGDITRAEGAPTASEVADAPPENGRHRSTAFELFILGELMDGPHHGYLLRDILARMLGPHRRISWAAIYPLIHQMERDGYIERDPASRRVDAFTPRESRRRLLRITAPGRGRFFALMRAADAYTADYRETFTIKLLYLRFLAPDEQRSQLEHGRGYLDAQVRHLRHVFSAASTTAPLPPEQRAAIFTMMRFRLTGAEAELRWVDDQLAMPAREERPHV